MESYEENVLRTRHAARMEMPCPERDVEDHKELVNIWEDAKHLENDN